MLSCKCNIFNSAMPAHHSLQVRGQEVGRLEGGAGCLISKAAR